MQKYIHTLLVKLPISISFGFKLSLTGAKGASMYELVQKYFHSRRRSLTDPSMSMIATSGERNFTS